jgi:hypothetical protein
MVNPEAVQEWHASPVTIEMMELLKKEQDRLMKSMAQGHFLNMDNPMGSFGSAAKTVGSIEGIATVFKLLSKEGADE